MLKTLRVNKCERERDSETLKILGLKLKSTGRWAKLTYSKLCPVSYCSFAKKLTRGILKQRQTELNARLSLSSQHSLCLSHLYLFSVSHLSSTALLSLSHLNGSGMIKQPNSFSSFHSSKLCLVAEKKKKKIK
jgi:hypothetical protein